MQKAALLKVDLAFASCAFAAGQVASPATSTLAPTQNASSSSGNVTSPTLNISGSYWTGSAPATDTWSIIDVLGTGSAPTSTLTFSHSAGAGVASLSAPMFQATGGSAGGISFSAGSVPLSFPSNSVTFYAPTPISPAFQVVLPGAAASGVVHWTNSSGTVTESVTNVTGTDCPSCLTGSSPTAGEVMIGQGSQALAAYPGITASGSPSLPILAVTNTSGGPDVAANQVTSGDTILLLKEVGGGSGNILDLQNSTGGHQFTLSQSGVVTNYGGLAAQGVTWVDTFDNVLNKAGNAAIGTQTLSVGRLSARPRFTVSAGT
jgi:hypothetical protein